MDWPFKFFYLFIGVVGAAFYARNAPTATSRLERMFPGKSPQFYERWNFVILIVVGMAVADAAYEPRDQYRAMIAGLSAVAVLNQIVETADPLSRRRRRSK